MKIDVRETGWTFSTEEADAWLVFWACSAAVLITICLSVMRYHVKAAECPAYWTQPTAIASPAK